MPSPSPSCSGSGPDARQHPGAWLLDEPSGVELQNLTKTQRDILTRSLKMKLGHLPLKDVLDSVGVKATFKAAESLKPAGSFRESRPEFVLKAALRPGGLGFCMDDETIVIDTAPNVRAAVDRRP